ncbi:DUF1156 domain-containing protein [Bifidobacterium vespertilionis]|uniref:DUF1156 domain-containing protein n=1 Tax=Bifidobacterium vespertilionis TaxID=2562524 RepID=UPI001CC31E52|nr:DUF1156 domain-containing protein [Bifidobacterium vespertilionis]
MTDTPRRKKLIETGIPLKKINEESAREKSLRHGLPSTLHLYWARRPLATTRSILFAQLVDDPSAHPDRFPTAEAQDAERSRLHQLMERLARWENVTDAELYREANRLITESCGGGLRYWTRSRAAAPFHWRRNGWAWRLMPLI